MAEDENSIVKVRVAVEFEDVVHLAFRNSGAEIKSTVLEEPEEESVVFTLSVLSRNFEKFLEYLHLFNPQVVEVIEESDTEFDFSELESRSISDLEFVETSKVILGNIKAWNTLKRAMNNQTDFLSQEIVEILMRAQSVEQMKANLAEFLQMDLPASLTFLSGFGETRFSELRKVLFHILKGPQK